MLFSNMLLLNLILLIDVTFQHPQALTENRPDLRSRVKTRYRDFS
jgi:hypothetical protein